MRRRVAATLKALGRPKGGKLRGIVPLRDVRLDTLDFETMVATTRAVLAGHSGAAIDALPSRDCDILTRIVRAQVPAPGDPDAGPALRSFAASPDTIVIYRRLFAKLSNALISENSVAVRQHAIAYMAGVRGLARAEGWTVDELDSALELLSAGGIARSCFRIEQTNRRRRSARAVWKAPWPEPHDWPLVITLAVLHARCVWASRKAERAGANMAGLGCAVAGGQALETP